MAIEYRIYANDGAGGTINLESPVGVTRETSWNAGQLELSHKYCYLVRSHDTETGMEDRNTDARISIHVGPGGEDVNTLPNPPHAVVARPTFGGGCRVDWAYVASRERGAADSFQVYLTPADSSEPAMPIATLDCVPGKIHYHCLIPGPLAAASYRVLVRSVNSTGEDVGSEDFSISQPELTSVMDSYQMEPVVISPKLI